MKARINHTLRVAALLLAFGASTASAQPYGPPPSSGTAYWQVPAFSDIALKGPGLAKGVVFWSHGLFGREPQYNSAPPDIVKDFARAGWDVIKVQRNNLFETTWIDSGLKHVADLATRAERARTEGYRHVILGGQSYGAAISLEASGKTPVFGVLAFAPGHGSDGCLPQAGNYPTRASENIPLLVAAIKGSKGDRVVVSAAAGDPCKGYADFNTPIAQALSQIGGAGLHFDTAMPIRGHFAALSNQFRLWYGACLRAFLDAERTPAKSTRCAAPDPAPKYLFPANYQPPTHVAGTMVGSWSGLYAQEARNNFSMTSVPAPPLDICVVIESEASGQAKAIVAFGAGPERDVSMSTSNVTMTREANRLVLKGTDQYRLIVEPESDKLALTIISRDGSTRWVGNLSRGC